MNDLVHHPAHYCYSEYEQKEKEKARERFNAMHKNK